MNQQALFGDVATRVLHENKCRVLRLVKTLALKFSDRTRHADTFHFA
jgi:hypothetical protein